MNPLSRRQIVGGVGTGLAVAAAPAFAQGQAPSASPHRHRWGSLRAEKLRRQGSRFQLVGGAERASRSPLRHAQLFLWLC